MMQLRRYRAFAPVAVVIFSLSMPVVPASAQNGRTGQIHITKDCSQYTFMAGGFCTIVTSDLPEISPGTKVFYDQSFGTPTGMLDSNVLLYVSVGNWATGRCTVEASTGLGLCTFSDGTGQLAGFTARINVRIDPATLITYWDGTYTFSPLPPK